MKNNLFLVSLFLLSLSLFAQKDPSHCSTIVLKNNMEIPAFINYINSGSLFYQRCPDSTSHQYSIPIDLIEFIRDPNGGIQTLSTPIPNFPGNDPIIMEDQPLDKWVFSKKSKNVFRTITREQNVNVVFLNSTNKIQKINGKWIQLTDKELIIDTQSNSSLAIPKKNIQKIIVLKKGRRIPKKNRRTIFLITAGAIFLLSLFKIFDRADQQGRIQSITGALAASLFISLIVTALVVVAILIISSTNAKSIKHPFKGEWEINYSSNENNDVREFYKQP